MQLVHRRTDPLVATRSTPPFSPAPLSTLGCLLLVLLLGVAVVPGASAPAPAHAEPTGNVIVSVNQTLDSDYGPPRITTRVASVFRDSSLTSGLEVVWGSNRITINSSPQHPLRRGLYPDANEVLATEAAPGLYVDAGFPVAAHHGVVDVLDLATDEAGRFTRFDIVFVAKAIDPEDTVFGEIRMNEPEQSPVLSPSATAFHWPAVHVGGPPILAAEPFTNTSRQRVRLGQVRVRRGATADYRIRSDRCSGRTLRPGTSCRLLIAYSPRAGGPRNAVLVLPVAGRTLAVSLSGQAPLGTSSFITSGGYPLGSTGVTFDDIWAEGFSSRGFVGYRWHSADKHQTGPNFLSLDFGAPTDPPALGTHRTSAEPPLRYLFDLLIAVRCNDMYGTVTVHDFRRDATYQPTHVDLTFRQNCVAYGRPTATFTGRLRWQDRKDLTAPAKPTKLRVAARKVSWTNSRSTDWASTLVRVVPGNGQGATTASGWAVSAGRARVSRLPRLVPGLTYSVVAFSVDKTGNTSPATIRTFTA